MITYRFEAERSHPQAPLAPPDGSLAAQALLLPKLSGTFGFDTNAAIVAQAGSPDRVTFADYATGFIIFDELDIGQALGSVAVTVTNGVTQIDAPHSTIKDEITLSTRALSTTVPIDAVTLQLQFHDAEQLQDVTLPRELDLTTPWKIKLLFTTRIDGSSSRANGQTATAQVLGIVSFDVTTVERAE